MQQDKFKTLLERQANPKKYSTSYGQSQPSTKKENSSNQNSQLTDEEFYRDFPDLASEEEHQQFASNYGSELVITIPPPKPLRK